MPRKTGLLRTSVQILPSAPWFGYQLSGEDDQEPVWAEAQGIMALQRSVHDLYTLTGLHNFFRFKT